MEGSRENWTSGTLIALPNDVKQLSKNRNLVRTLLITSYIAAVLLFSGLARADESLLDGVASIFGF